MKLHLSDSWLKELAHFKTKNKLNGKIKREFDDGDSALSKERNFKCEYPSCGKAYSTARYLREHQQRHVDAKLSCSVCDRRFKIKGDLRQHMKSHTDTKEYACRWKCGAVFKQHGGRITHERINHYEKNPLRSECDICGRPCDTKLLLLNHRVTHLSPAERTDYCCSFCGKFSTTIKQRERHEERHRVGNVFTCSKCDRDFISDRSLSCHMKVHNTASGGSDSAASENKATKKPPPNTHCHVCGPPQLFGLSSLRKHLACVHSTNFKCHRCDKGFRKRSQMEAHLESSHRHGECRLCGATFRRIQNADIHMSMTSRKNVKKCRCGGVAATAGDKHKEDNSLTGQLSILRERKTRRMDAQQARHGLEEDPLNFKDSHYSTMSRVEVTPEPSSAKRLASPSADRHHQVGDNNTLAGAAATRFAELKDHDYASVSEAEPTLMCLSFTDGGKNKEVDVSSVGAAATQVVIFNDRNYTLISGVDTDNEPGRTKNLSVGRYKHAEFENVVSCSVASGRDVGSKGCGNTVMSEADMEIEPCHPQRLSQEEDDRHTLPRGRGQGG